MHSVFHRKTLLIMLATISMLLLGVQGLYAKWWKAWDETMFGYSRVCTDGVRFAMAAQDLNTYKVEFYIKPSLANPQPIGSISNLRLNSINNLDAASIPFCQNAQNPNGFSVNYCKGPIYVPWTRSLPIGAEIEAKAYYQNYQNSGRDVLIGSISRLNNNNQVQDYRDFRRSSPNGNQVNLCNMTDTAEIVVGLGKGGNGFFDLFGISSQNSTYYYDRLSWLQLPWTAYNSRYGSTYPAIGDIDNDIHGRTSDDEEELVVGLGTGAGGWFEINGVYSIREPIWAQVPWPAYNTQNGETRPAIGDLDGGGEDEIILGLGRYGKGFLELREGASGWFDHREWWQVPWTDYNNLNGETRPATGDLDNNGREELVIGLGPVSNGYLEVVETVVNNDNSIQLVHSTWLQVPWTDYNNLNGETRPALGDLDGDRLDELVIGLGRGAQGWFLIVDGNYQIVKWGQVAWPNYNNLNGETRPALGDLDGDGRDEIVIGLGSGAGGWYQIFDDATTGYANRGWIQLDWPVYNNANGETWPAISEATVNLSAESTLVVTSEEQRDVLDRLQIFTSTLQGPPLHLSKIEGSAGPPESKTTHAGPPVVALDSSLAPPTDTAFYPGPPKSDAYYPGPPLVDSDDSSEKLFLPFVTAQ